MSKNNFAFQGIKDVQIKYPRLERLFIPPLMFKVSWSNINSHNFFFYAFLIDFWATYLTIFSFIKSVFREKIQIVRASLSKTHCTRLNHGISPMAMTPTIIMSIRMSRRFVYLFIKNVSFVHTTIIIVSEILPFFSLLTEFLTCSRHIIH